MQPIVIATAALALTLSAGPGSALELYRVKEVSGAPASIWEEIGDFCAIADWHPMVESCDRSEQEGVTYRTLSLTTGITVKDRLIETSGTSYAYEAAEWPLSLTNYRATFGVRAIAERTFIFWKGTFDSFDDRDDRNLVDLIYWLGLDAIVECRKAQPDEKKLKAGLCS